MTTPENTPEFAQIAPQPGSADNPAPALAWDIDTPQSKLVGSARVAEDAENALEARQNRERTPAETKTDGEVIVHAADGHVDFVPGPLPGASDVWLPTEVTNSDALLHQLSQAGTVAPPPSPNDGLKLKLPGEA